jgi:hypothetical protein
LFPRERKPQAPIGSSFSLSASLSLLDAAFPAKVTAQPAPRPRAATPQIRRHVRNIAAQRTEFDSDFANATRCREYWAYHYPQNSAAFAIIYDAREL